LCGVKNANLSKGGFTVSGNCQRQAPECFGSDDPRAQGPTISIATTCSDDARV
jgi:hypothetical protein